jgi:preprotein translocase subunit SecF
VLAGTYSSIFIASPTLVIWQQLFSRNRGGAERAKAPKKTKPSKA